MYQVRWRSNHHKRGAGRRQYSNKYTEALFFHSFPFCHFQCYSNRSSPFLFCVFNSSNILTELHQGSRLLRPRCQAEHSGEWLILYVIYTTAPPTTKTARMNNYKKERHVWPHWALGHFYFLAYLFLTSCKLATIHSVPNSRPVKQEKPCISHPQNQNLLEMSLRENTHNAGHNHIS